MSRQCVVKHHSVNESPSTLVPLADKINQRLGHMKDVAGYKADHHLPIENVEQESKVINDSLTEAEDLGLDRESVRPFIIAQISAAKAIQYRYRAQWLSVPEKDWQPQPLDVVREKIALASSDILQQLALLAKDGPIQANERNAFVVQLDQNNLSCQDKWRLFEALLVVRPVAGVQ